MQSRSFRDIPSPLLLLIMLLAIAWLYAFLSRDPYNWDFRIYYVASKTMHAHLDPYLSYGNLSDTFVVSDWPYRDSAFIYPPTSLFFFGPIYRLSFVHAKAIFGAITAVSLAAVLAALYARNRRSILVPVLLYMSLPVLINREAGNIEAIVFVLTTTAFLLDDSVLSGLSLAAAITLKLHPALLLPWFLVRKRWTTLTTAALAAAALAISSLFLWGRAYWLEFLFNLTHHFGPHKGLLTYRPAYNEIVGSPGSLSFITTPLGTFSAGHELFGRFQNPFHIFHRAGVPLALSFTAIAIGWLLFSASGRRLSDEQSYFRLTVACLFANPLLWPTCLVTCFPLTMMLIEQSSAPNLATALLVFPLFAPVSLVGSRNFALWLLSVMLCAGLDGRFHTKRLLDGSYWRELTACSMFRQRLGSGQGESE